MPLNVRRFNTSVLLVLVCFVVLGGAQTVPPVITPPQQTAPTSGDVMRARISKAKAFIAVRNYHAAIFELENIRKETSDTAVQGVVNVLLMNSYLEQGDYKRAQDLLNEFYAAQKTTRANAPASYMAVAGQIVKGARSRVERYRALGLSVSDRTLPLEASNDLEKMRETLELVITQSKEIGTNKARSSDAMMLLEEASSSRSMLARDDYDSRRWKDEVADTREQMANGGSVVLSAVSDAPTGTPPGNLVAENTKPAENQPMILPVVDTKAVATREREVKTAETKSPDLSAEQTQKATLPAASKDETKAPDDLTKTPIAKDASPLDVGSLKEYATKQAMPVYPPVAKSIRATGVVKVEFTVNESGDVSEVQKTSGPSLLQAAAKDAIKKWKFKPFVRDGQPVRATGFVNFNFAL